MAGNKQKKKEKAFKEQQQQYQARAQQLFPELDKESFMYQNPTMNNAINAALSYRMGNMFGNWGMPQDMRGGQGNMNDFFAAMMPQPQASPAQPGVGPGGGGGYGGGGTRGRGNRGGRGGRGWINDVPMA